MTTTIYELFKEIKLEQDNDNWRPLPYYVAEGKKWYSKNYPDASESELENWLVQLGIGFGRRFSDIDNSLNQQVVNDAEIRWALEDNGNNRTRAAQQLGLSLRSLNRRLEKKN